MKKLIYSLAIALMGMTSCTSFDEEQSVKYGDGPAVSINLTTTTDSTFTFTVNPADGTKYYSYVVVSGKADESVSESSVLKATLSGAIQSSIVEYAQAASTTVNMRNAQNQPLCMPNNDYVVYAIAQDSNGVTGKVATLEVTTTDGDVPVLLPYEAKDPTDENDTVTTVTFSEEVALGEGKVSASYYQEWGNGSLIAIPEDDIDVTIDGSKVSFAVNNVPAGAFVFYSWTVGAFVDSFGNKCPAVTTQLTEQGVSGVYRRQPLQSWVIEDDNILPEAGSYIADYQTFQGTMTFDHDIFRNDELVEDGDISVVYTNSKKTSTIALATDQWSVSGKTLTFTLPEAAAAGDIITIKVKADVIFDINGNGNEEYTSTTETVWWAYFSMTKDMAIGDFTFSVTSGSETEECGIATIAENPEVENGLIITNLYMEGSEIPGRYDLSDSKIYVSAGYPLGVTTYGSTSYGLITYSLSDQEEIAFTVNPDGTMTSTDFCVVACDASFENLMGWWDKPDKATFTPAKATTRSKAATGRKASAKSGVKTVNIDVNARNLKTLRK